MSSVAINIHLLGHIIARAGGARPDGTGGWVDVFDSDGNLAFCIFPDTNARELADAFMELTVGIPEPGEAPMAPVDLDDEIPF